MLAQIRHIYRNYKKLTIVVSLFFFVFFSGECSRTRKCPMRNLKISTSPKVTFVYNNIEHEYPETKVFCDFFMITCGLSVSGCSMFLHKMGIMKKSYDEHLIPTLCKIIIEYGENKLQSRLQERYKECGNLILFFDGRYSKFIKY